MKHYHEKLFWRRRVWGACGEVISGWQRIGFYSTGELLTRANKRAAHELVSGLGQIKAKQRTAHVHKTLHTNVYKQQKIKGQVETTRLYKVHSIVYFK